VAVSRLAHIVFSRKLDRFLLLRRGLNANGAKWQISRKQHEIRAVRLIRSIRAEKILVLEKTMVPPTGRNYINRTSEL
jgi:hypothetical protein